jgi:cellulose synthase/poly-beta-1,6-N-acetylglucosamine synthase-like glycosyltransferase
MYWLLSILFWLSVAAILHSYLLYPLILRMAAMGKKQNEECFSREDLPQLSILMSAYNEEAVIEAKIESIFSSNYPLDKIHLYIGSDCSDDQTNAMVNAFVKKYPANLHFFPFEERRGKPRVINEIARQAANRYPFQADHILLITDANVMLLPDTLYELVKHFKNPAIALVDSNIQHPSVARQGEGIGKNEQGYISREVGLKNLEGRAWGAMVGPLGGCYALRSTHFAEVPLGYLVDDFYIAMKAFEKGGKAINEPKAICHEDVSSSIAEEFRRKTRISTGNFTNLATFWRLLLPKYGALAFAFFSHKVLRWLGPFFMMIALITNACLAFLWAGNLFYQILFILQIVGFLGVPLLDYLTKKLGMNLPLLRYITYFIAMNLALLKGFFNYLKGVRNNVWQPTKRNLG